MVTGADAVFSVVLCTFNRSDRIEGAVRAILDQEGCDLELIVVDDGSVDDTPKVLASIDDPRLRVVRRPNGGLSRARNTGLAAATGDCVTFIDDDDRAEPGWLATFAKQVEPSVGIVCCGATFVGADGSVLFSHHPALLGGPYGRVVGSWLAGTFAVRTALVRRAGGYLDGLGNRHQSELFIRLLAVAAAEGLRMTSDDVPGVRIEAVPATSRRDVNPRRLYDATRWILARHVVSFAGHRQAIGMLEGVAGINAARVGDWSPARRRLLRSALAAPRSRAAWGRLALACVPAVGRRVWHRHGTWGTPGNLPLGVPDQSADAAGEATPELFLTWGYQENPPVPPGGGVGDGSDAGAAGGDGATGSDGETLGDGATRGASADRGGGATGGDGGTSGDGATGGASADRGGGATGGDGGTSGGTGPGEPAPAPAADPGWGDVHRLADRLGRRRGWAPVVSVGCDGPGPSSGQAPRPVVCHDVIERVDDPITLLQRLARTAAGAPVLVSAHDRDVHDPDRPVGPPTEPRHRREWSYDQFELLLHSTGFDIERVWRLPAAPPGAGTARRLRARRGLRRRRSGMAFLVRARSR